MINTKNKKEAVIESLTIKLQSLCLAAMTLDCKFSPKLFDMCLLEIADPVYERIFEKKRIQLW